jgi:hypothetical protein
VQFPASLTGDNVQSLRRDVAMALATITSVGQATLLLAQSIGTTSTAIRHGLKTKPRAVFTMPTTNAVIYQIAVADAVYVYLAASVAAVADVMVIQ